MAQTALQNQQQDEQAAAGYDAVIPAQIDTGSTVPPFYQTNHVAAEMAKNPQITPPTTGEIHKQMWVSSMMMGLMTALATGNVAGGIVGGMWAAIGVHDYGYSLRQRSEYIDRLKGDGYSMPAILKWYEDGDSKELDKERQDMLQRDKMMQQDREFNQRLDQQDSEFKARQALQESEFGQRMAMQGARLEQMAHHQGIMENIALQNAGSARIAAIAKMGAEAGTNASAGAGMGGQGSGGVSLQNASFDPSKVQMPAGADNWSPQEKAAYIAAAGQAYHGQMLKDAVKQVTAAKNLRVSESQQTGMYDKILTAAQKVNQTPDNASGDHQLLMQFQVGESPNVSPRTTQIEPLMEGMTTGTWDSIANKFNRYTGRGLTDSEREQARALTRENAKTQAASHLDHVLNVVTTGGYDVTNPEVLSDLVAAFHVDPKTIVQLANGTITPQDAADAVIEKVSPGKATDFGDLPTSKPKSNHGSW